MTQSLFNPNYLKLNLELLTPAFIPALGMSAWWTLWMLVLHGLWSISTPIALIECCVPSRARLPWAGRVGLAIIAVVFGVGATAASVMNFRMDPFLSSQTQFAGAALAILVFVGLAFLLPVRPRCDAPQDAPSPLLLGLITLALGSAVMLVPKDWGWGAVGALLALDAAMLLAILTWSRRGAMRLSHQLALGSGAALAYGIHAFVQDPSVGKLEPSVRIGNAIFLIATVALIAFATRRVRRYRRRSRQGRAASNNSTTGKACQNRGCARSEFGRGGA